VVKDLARQPSAGDWRQGAAAVAVLSFDADAEAPILAEGDHYAEDLSTMSHQAYGPRVGVPRILKLLAHARSRLPSSYRASRPSAGPGL
jgi:peptidoglycan-N-acetylglucosamine deacetylase